MMNPVADDTLRFDIPHSARVWNYWLGGKDNYPADRSVGDKMAKEYPQVAVLARQSRQVLIRAVTYLAAEVGIDQFLDIGTGLPSMDNTHEVAQRVNRAAKIVYVDNDPLVLVHARTLLKNTTPEGVTEYVQADVREPKPIIEAAAETLDLTRPVAVMLLGILGHATPRTEHARAVITELMAAMPSGSYLTLLDGTSTSEAMRRATAINGYAVRTIEEFQGFFDGFEMVEPGLVPLPEWRPIPGGEHVPPIDSYVGMARKP
jgi:O-methyltransferase involved in polyketide biosynthesis